MSKTKLDGYLTENEAVQLSGFALSTLREWRRCEDYGPPYGPPYVKILNRVFYIKAGFEAAVLHRGAKPKRPIGRKVDPQRRAAGLHMQPKGPDAAIVKRLMNSIRHGADRTERHGQLSYYYHTNLNVDGDVCYVFNGEKLVDVIEPPIPADRLNKG